MGKISTETDNVFKVTLPGYDVDTATPEQCAVHSGFDYPKIEESLEGYEEVTLPSTISEGDTILLTIDHDYGYIPNVLVYIDTKGVHPTEFDILPFIFADPVFMWYDFDVTTTQLEIKFVYVDSFGAGDLTTTPAGETVGFKYQVWVND